MRPPWRWRGWLLASVALAAPAGRAQTPPNAAIAVLLGQAAYWRAQGQPEQADAALRRVLRADPDNAAALALLPQTGDPASPEALAAALRADPDDLAAQLAYAQALAGHRATREAGITRLSALTHIQALAWPARDAWRWALLHAADRPQLAAQLDAFLARFPGDPAVTGRRALLAAGRLDQAAQLRSIGYQALQAGRDADADRAYNAALVLDPDDVDALAMLSVLRRGQGQDEAARQLLERAAALAPERRDELLGAPVRYAANDTPGIATDATLPPAVPGEPVTRAYEPAPGLDALINQPAAPQPPGWRAVQKVQDGPVQPARPDMAPDAAGSLPTLRSEVRPQPPLDPVMAEIDRRINEAPSDVAADVTVSLALRGRSEPGGLASLYDLSAPVQATYSPAGFGTLTLGITPETLLPGSASSALEGFGSNRLAPAGSLLRQGQSGVTGVGLSLGARYQFASADIGTTPLGFLLTSVVGGVTLAPPLGTGLVLRATLDRRAVTDSLLSYAGEKDPRTGLGWGGVTRDGAHVQLEGSSGPTTYYAGGGGGLLTGQNVRRNTEVDAGAGFSVPVWSTGAQEIRTGLDVSYSSYGRNLQSFSFGSGGYFSPQDFYSGLIPLTYRQTVSPALRFSLGGTLGVQSYTERSTPAFQQAGLQQQLLALAAAVPATATTLAGSHSTGVAGGAHGEVEYRALQHLHVGLQASLDHTGNFTQGTGVVYARYAFSEGG